MRYDCRENGPHVKRRLLNLLTLLSRLLCGAVVALWARSYFVQDLFQRQWQGR
jgi:hypothetical protein